MTCDESTVPMTTYPNPLIVSTLGSTQQKKPHEQKINLKCQTQAQKEAYLQFYDKICHQIKLSDNKITRFDCWRVCFLATVKYYIKHVQLSCRVIERQLDHYNIVFSMWMWFCLFVRDYRYQINVISKLLQLKPSKLHGLQLLTVMVDQMTDWHSVALYKYFCQITTHINRRRQNVLPNII